MVISMLSLSLTWLIAVLLGNAFWLTNDDLTMIQMASGAYTGSPSSQLGFVHSIIGLPISFLYALTDQIPWYLIAQAFSIIISFVLLSQLLVRSLFLGWLFVSIAVTAWIALNPNFTITAIIAAGVGVLLSFNSVRQGGFPFAGLSLFVVGTMWRQDSALLALLMLAPFLIFALRNNSTWINSGRKILYLLTLPFAALLLSRLRSLCFYSDYCSTWGNYLSTQSLAGTFHTRTRGELLVSLGEPSNLWSDSITRLFINFSYPDSAVYSLSNLQVVDQSFPTFLQYPGSSPISLINLVMAGLSDFWLLLLGAATLSLLPVVIQTANRVPFILKGISTLLWPVSILVALSLLRVTFAIYFGVAVLIVSGWFLLSTWKLRDEPASSHRRYWWPSQFLGLVVITSWLFLGPISVLSTSTHAEQMWLQGRNFQENLRQVVGTTPAFGQGNLADYFQGNPYLSNNPTKDYPILLSGWPVFSPPFSERKDRLGFTDVIEDLRNSVADASPKAMFIGSGSNALDLAQVMTETDKQGRTFTAIDRGLLTDPSDIFVGQISAWTFEPSN